MNNTPQKQFYGEPNETERCPACGSRLQIHTETHTGDNIPPGGFTEIWIECPNGCDIDHPESRIL